ncbi:hypothetical protein LOTGIDRAFT_163224 [Lottia gigantea]|uniref:Uncharacterized protein n=1 Tax=Lottia gigantea TaxID=225164 RepID=V3ZKL7_LOTGI|nr:hypothetical protein LOTGIDRAFT_163224 [Lottia gigantea]ESO91863.1 hypothetical protein LOTGIDRAFT_163224 [Lottia gigantea]
MDEICNVLKEFIRSDISQSETRSDTRSDISQSDTRSDISQSDTRNDTRSDISQTISDLDSEYPKAESARPFLPEEEKEFVKPFNKQRFRPRTAILTVWFDYPKNMFFQLIPAKDKITFTNKEEVLTAVDIQEIVKAGGRIIRILDGIVYKENFKTHIEIIF